MDAGGKVLQKQEVRTGLHGPVTGSNFRFATKIKQIFVANLKKDKYVSWLSTR